MSVALPFGLQSSVAFILVPLDLCEIYELVGSAHGENVIGDTQRGLDRSLPWLITAKGGRDTIKPGRWVHSPPTVPER